MKNEKELKKKIEHYLSHMKQNANNDSRTYRIFLFLFLFSFIFWLENNFQMKHYNTAH